ncbi:GNAT family N-acetyltransferase [Algibacter sp.]|nr:GNAT family N-acetyltransferase [Algibacter sp.]
MKVPFIKYSKYNFSFDFFQNQHINSFYDKLFNYTNDEEVLNPNFESEGAIGNTIHEIKFIPSYFRLESTLLSHKYKLVKYQRVEGFRINLDGFSNAEHYLEGQMGPKSRSQLRRRINRLETCFNIKYTFYYGQITKQEYDCLFNALELLIERRFTQRGDAYSLKDKWKFIKEDTYQLILEKKASLFVIYDENKPIDICLNYHFQNIVQHLIRSYDIDYSKYGLGQIDIYKQIDWCFLNNFKIFDLMWGELDYKIRWCNEISIFEHHFIFKNDNPLKSLFVKILINLYKISDHIKQKSIYKSLVKAKSNFTQNRKGKSEKKDSVIKFETISKMPLKDAITVININNESYKSLRKTVYDFQYIHFENTANIKVFKINSATNSYIIQGTKSQIKVSII